MNFTNNMLSLKDLMCQPWQFEDSSFGKKRQLILSIYFVLTVTSSQWCPHNYPQSNISNSCLVSEFFHLQPLNYNNFIHGNKIGISKYNKLTGTFFHFKSPTTLVISGHHWTHTFTQRSLFFWPSLPPWHLIVIRDLPPKFNSLNSAIKWLSTIDTQTHTHKQTLGPLKVLHTQ